MTDDPNSPRPRKGVRPSLGRSLSDIVDSRQGAGVAGSPIVDPFSTQAEREQYLSEIPAAEDTEIGDTGWINVGSTRVRQVRFVPSGPGMFDVGNLYVRFHKYDTAYVYRGVGRPLANNVHEMGMAGSGIGSYINSVLNGFSRDYCTDEELNKYFEGYGGTYRGP